MENSKKGHRVPLKEDSIELGAEVVRNSDVKILEDISLFMPGATSVFCLPCNAVHCQGVLATLATRPYTITVLSLPMLLFMLGNSSMEGQALPSINNVEAALEKEQFMFMDMGPGEGGVPDPLFSLMG